MRKLFSISPKTRSAGGLPGVIPPLLTLLLITLLSASAVAQQASAPSQLQATAQALSGQDSGTPQMVTKILDNGLTVVILPSKVVPIVTIEIAVKNGAFTETPQLSGLSHLFEHMFFKSNAVIPNQEAYMKRMRELGIVFNGTTSNERVNYFFTLPKENLVPGLKFMYDAITSVKFEDTEFAKEKEVVVGEIDRNEASPYYLFYLRMLQALYYKYPNRKNALGTRESVRAATTKMMQTMKDTYYVPNNSALLIAGDVDPEVAIKDVIAQFSSWKKGRDPFKRHKVPTHPPLKKNDYFVVNQPVNVPVFEMDFHGPSVGIDTKATYAADVMSQLLSQPDSPFQKALVDSQLAYAASFTYYTQAHIGSIGTSVVAAPDKINQAITVLVQELKKLQDPSYYTPEALKNAKTLITVHNKYDQEKPSSYIHTVSFYWSVGGLSYLDSYIPQIQAVTAQDLADFAKKYIDSKHFAAGLLANQEQSKQFGFTAEALKQVVEAAEKGESAPTPTSNPTTSSTQGGAP